MNLVHNFIFYLFITHFNIFLTPPSPPKWSLPLGFPTKILYGFLNTHMQATRPTHLILLDLITLIISVEVYKL